MKPQDSTTRAVRVHHLRLQVLQARIANARYIGQNARVAWWNVVTSPVHPTWATLLGWGKLVAQQQDVQHES